MSTLGKRIKKARAKVSQEVFAREIEVSKGSLGFYERDENLPNTNVVLKICSVTGVLLEWLLMGSGPMYKESAPSFVDGVALYEIAPRESTLDSVVGEAIGGDARGARSHRPLDILHDEGGHKKGKDSLLSVSKSSEKANNSLLLRCESLEKKLDKVESQRDELALENRELWRRIDMMRSENFELRLALERMGASKKL